MEFCFEKWNLFRPDPCIINLFEEAFNDDENRIFFCFVYLRTIVWFHQVTSWNRCLEISISRVNTSIARRAYLVQLKIVSRRIKIVSRPSYAVRSSTRRLLIPLGNRRISAVSLLRIDSDAHSRDMPRVEFSFAADIPEDRVGRSLLDFHRTGGSFARLAESIDHASTR